MKISSIVALSRFLLSIGFLRGLLLNSLPLRLHCHLLSFGLLEFHGHLFLTFWALTGIASQDARRQHLWLSSSLLKVLEALIGTPTLINRPSLLLLLLLKIPRHPFWPLLGGGRVARRNISVAVARLICEGGTGSCWRLAWSMGTGKWELAVNGLAWRWTGGLLL